MTDPFKLTQSFIYIHGELMTDVLRSYLEINTKFINK